ncbi:hypothetical protein [Paenibacillus sp. 7516]|uniref:hypothetical protein n=1 Tax=Paenibacillus sp. 7516 TaxID=2022549 RepID=UPI000BA70593|nr:hypothetical protein [Paenibacillus sp. 7516]PAF30857.1 hypothetical protein CHI14_15655 [Paenibacillus sp. 7516]
MYAVIANVIEDNQLRTGAKVYILYCHGMDERSLVYGMAKGGKRIEKYISYKKLKKFRSQWVPEHIRHRVQWSYEHRADADHRAQTLDFMWTNVRAFNSAGDLIKEGLSQNEVYQTYSHIKFIEQKITLVERKK